MGKEATRRCGSTRYMAHVTFQLSFRLGNHQRTDQVSNPPSNPIFDDSKLSLRPSDLSFVPCPDPPSPSPIAHPIPHHTTWTKMASQTPYQPQDALDLGIRCGAIGGGIGLFMSAAQNSLSHQTLGVMSVFTRTGAVIGYISEFCRYYP